MNADPSVTTIDASEHISVGDTRAPAWGAVIAGLVAAVGVHFLLMMAGTAAGLGAVEPATDDNPVATIGAGAAIVWSISALIAMGVGGWVAGRCAVRVHSVSGGVHGFLVWCLATIITLFLLASGVGRVIGGAAQVAGQGLQVAGQAAGGVADLAKTAVEQSTAMNGSFIDEVVQSRGDELQGGQAVAARREIGQAVRTLFAEGGDLRDTEAREALVQAMTRSAGVEEAEANRMVDQWIASAETARAELNEAKDAAVAKAKEAADKSAEALAHAAGWTFVGFLLGAIVAIFGGRKGASWEYHHTELAADPRFDPTNRRSPARVHSTPATGTV